MRTWLIPLMAVSIFVANPCVAEPALDFSYSDQELMLQVSGLSSSSQRVEFNDGFGSWSIASANKGNSQWSAVAEMPSGARLFRVVESIPPVIVPNESWKNELTLPEEAFLSENLGESFVTVKWVKFVMIIDDCTRVYFQDSSKYLFHYNFASDLLAPFVDMSSSEFDSVTLSREGQQAILGAVLVAPYTNEFAVQVVGEEPYPREMLRYVYEVVDESIGRGEQWQGFYMPTAAHAAAARANSEYFESHGIPLAEPDRWSGQGGCYVGGWALGRLRYFAHDEIEEAYANGDLLPSDILLTDLVPAELPYVAGILTLTPTTPNSHVAILAESYGIPFAYLEDEPSRLAALALDGRRVALRTSNGYFGSCNFSILDASNVPEDYAGEILDLKSPPDLNLAAKVPMGAVAVDDLATVWPEDIRHVGGKAANFGFLRRVIPDNTPQAMAFTFDLWDDYMDQDLGVRTLREEIALRLAPLAQWPADIAALTDALEEVRDLIKDTSDFSAIQQAAILDGLSSFETNRKLRFRSSTNVEDSDAFVGAGLYDSYSGCIMDDIDGDDVGPSHCDPDQDEERGVFRAMRKVYASFYNLNAYLERVRHGVDESQVGMALLVHYSFPDEIEAGNGVAVSQRNTSFSTTSVEVEMVSQKGAVSVTNPEGGAIPEVVETYVYRGNSNFQGANLQQRSSLCRLGEEAVMNWEDDYLALGVMMYDLGEAFVEHFPAKVAPRLEFEYKRLTDGELVIKQMREVPAASHATAPGIALIDTPATLEVFQGEYGTAMGNHRLKSIWILSGENRWVEPEDVSQSLVAEAQVQIALKDSVEEFSGKPAFWPRHAFSSRTQGQSIYVRDSWAWISRVGRTGLWLEALLPTGSEYSQDPIRSFSQHTLYLGADYPRPVLDFSAGWQGADPSTTLEDVVRLVEGHPDSPPQEGSLLQTRSGTRGKVIIQTQFYWPPYPTGPTAGYTAPMEKWVATTITGLTLVPVVLQGYYSQTYRPGHHNFSESFVFEPALEEGIAARQLAELEAAGVRQIFWHVGGNSTVIKLISADGKVRDPQGGGVIGIPRVIPGGN
ncbi:MAG: hypothetical protein GY899_04325 [Verrucomicrobiaceae bacterium]|nr:hypothetical protein [Verrucomicrobiaceae bacterium]